MKIGLFTYHFSDNYGALMQAYGLRQWLIEEGYQAEFINYHPRYVEEGGNFSGLFNPKRLKANLKILYLSCSAFQRRYFGNRDQEERFKRFRSDILGVDTKRLETHADVESAIASTNKRYDLLICGSDQIWNPSLQRGVDPIYFLAVGSGLDLRRVAYAPSFGSGELAAAYKKEVADLIKGLDGVSVREESGVGIVKAIADVDAVSVPDPSILLGDFSRLVKAGKPEVAAGSWVFCYALRSGDRIRDVAEIVGSALGCQIHSPYNTHRRWREIGETVFPSPAGWLAMIESSAFVVTNSFHGTALSILLKKPFLAVALPDKKRNLNERVCNLLSQVGLMDRFVESSEPEFIYSKLRDAIDWGKASERLSNIQEKGRSYLRKQIQLAVHD